MDLEGNTEFNTSFSLIQRCINQKGKKVMERRDSAVYECNYNLEHLIL